MDDTEKSAKTFLNEQPKVWVRLFLFFTHLLFFISFLKMLQTDNITMATVNCQGLATPDKQIRCYQLLQTKTIFHHLSTRYTFYLHKKHSLNHNGDTNAILILICQIRGVCVFFITIILSSKYLQKKDSWWQFTYFRSVHWRQQGNPYKHIWPKYR